MKHLTGEQLGELVEGTLTRERAAAYHLHLADCAGCAAAWADAVRYRAAWLRQPGQFGLAKGVAAHLARDSGPSARPSRTPATLRLWLPAARVATAVVAVGAWALHPWRATPTLGFDLPPAVRASIESSSARELVLPGGERHADRAAPGKRSGAISGSLGLTHEVAELTARYEGGERSADGTTRLVAALLACGDLEAANAYAREGLRAYPADVRLLVLMAELRYRASDLVDAERHLRTAARIAPGDPVVGLDLALVVSERGDAAEARKWFERVAASGPPPLAARARQELQR